MEDGVSNEPTTETTKTNPVQAVDDASTTKDESGWSNRNQKGLQISGFDNSDKGLSSLYLLLTRIKVIISNFGSAGMCSIDSLDLLRVICG